MMYAKKTKGDMVAYIEESEEVLLCVLIRKQQGKQPQYWMTAKSKELLEKENTFAFARSFALDDFVPTCQKIGGAPLGKDAYTTSISCEPCDGSEFSLIVKTTIGQMRVEKSYPITFEHFVQEVFGLCDIWNMKMF